MTFFETFIDTIDVFLQGMLLTFQLTVVSVFIAIFIGLFFAFMKISKVKVLEIIADLYIFIVRGTPLIVQIFIFYFGLTELDISGFWSVVLGLAFHNGAYIAEIFRGTIQSIDKGQMEAGRSLGMSNGLTMRRIILPQAFRRALPPMGNQFIIALKDSSLASFIGMFELFSVATTLGSNNFDYMTYLLIVAVYYLVLVLFFSMIVNLVEKRMSLSD
ncbi:amino acid ABC transporter permease [Rossellomorea vietnamensis]|uniref:Amino acid ABC transporter permease n=2 Tax=Rossellomorea TaxID=2837508 RepID=A0A5D4KKN8_9BACI|nr:MULTISPECIES: amino acid ABC transporter permease [Rossellomorea]TYR76863.1 amino acid ABC transporter permease [Rossellomorea vietnamensis]TYS19658.1 amino acid ABC transporter permease [Rossellomorea vietnamensis]TYS84077.1 amino acid ABC transporter permease [Rossellomorea aquimaris]